MPVWRDKDGAIIQNSAKGPLPKPQIEPVSVGIIRATVRKSSYTDSDYKTQLNSVNDSTWRAWTAGQAWCAKIRTKPINEGGTDYTLVRYIVLCCEYGWKSITPDMGQYYLSSSNPKVFADASGYPYMGCLDGSGAKLASTTDMVIKEFSIKRPVAFSFLGF